MSGAPDGGPAGYDGQYYAALATDPLLRNAGTARALDTPTYRATRIGVPFLAWLLAFGQPRAAVVLYVLIIWGLGLAAVYFAARWLGLEATPCPWAALLPLAGGLAASMIRATPDIAATGLILGALLLHRGGKNAPALAVLVMAVMTRETSLIAAGAIALIELRDRRFVRAALFTAMPGLALAVWQLYLRSRGLPWHDAGAGNFRAPFASLLAKGAAVLQLRFDDAWPELAGVAAVVTFLPQILFLFLFLGLLEDTGYMARAALICHKPLRQFGLTGKSFIQIVNICLVVFPIVKFNCSLGKEK
jgi:hypothetical protein